MEEARDDGGCKAEGPEPTSTPSTKKKRKRSPKELEKRKLRRKLRIRSSCCPLDLRKALEPSLERNVVSKNQFVDFFDDAVYVGRALYLKKCFPSSLMVKLASLLRSEVKFWKTKPDKTRGLPEKNYMKSNFTAGRRNMQGHFRPEDPSCWAHSLKLPQSFTNSETFSVLQEVANTATHVLRKYFPDSASFIDNEKYLPSERIFGLFHLFMATTGVTSFHRDRNDYATFHFILESPPNSKGGLEIGGANLCFKGDVGDALLFDADELYHAPRDYKGDPDDRMVGVFIIHKTFLRLLGVIKK